MKPLVCCVLPFHRPEFVDEAIACFESQDYENKRLISVDTSKHRGPIGKIRNDLNAMAPAGSILAHFDHDDWSCPTRISEQVAFLESSGAAVVGYRDMPFYNVSTGQVTLYKQPNPHYALGTSLLYWRSAWERHPFMETAGDEDAKFEQAVGFENVATQSSVWDDPKSSTPTCNVRMVARIHPSNTSPKGGARYEKATPELTAAVLSCLSRCNVAQSS